MLNKEGIITNTINSHVFKKKIDADKIFLVVLSDIHEGQNDRKYFKSIIDFILSIKNCYVIIGGDAVNMITKTSKGTAIEEWCSGDKQFYNLVEDLKPLVEYDRIIAVAESGNHGDRIYQDVYMCANQILACLLGIPQLYTGTMCLGFITLKRICYTISIVHKNRKTKNYYEFARVDLLYKEHWHELSYEQKLVYEWNKYTKSVSVIPTYEIYNGSFLNLPAYSQKMNYRPQFMGCYFTLLDGNKRHIQPFIDKDLEYIIKQGVL